MALETKDQNDNTPKTQNVSTGRQTAPTEPTKSEAPVRKNEEEQKPQSYVWLADGSVLRAYDEDLPGAAGAQHPFGFWQKDGYVFEIIGVYRTEVKAEE